MSNLIITIISIGLAAVAAIMAIYYGGTAFQSANTQATFNAWISQNQQLLAAAQAYSLDYATTYVPMCGLYNGKYLSTWPNLIDQQPAPSLSGTITTSTFENATWSYTATRTIVNYRGRFFIATVFYPPIGYWTDASNKNLQPQQFAILFNQLNSAQIPAGLTYFNGVPQVPASATYGSADSGGGACVGNSLKASAGAANINLDTSGNPMIGCYIGATSSAENAKIRCLQPQ